MTETIAAMTKEELATLVEATVERKLIELLGDPDEGLEISEPVRTRLLQQKQAVATGERERPFDDVIRGMGLD